jgi:metacaspase-1
VRIRTALIWCLPTFLFFQAQEAWSFDKKALLIGIGEYEHPRYAAQPLQASYGLSLIAQTLEGLGFEPGQINILSDSQARFIDIEKAVQGLIDNIEPGAQVVLYLYGHGVIITDDNGDEEDGLDEAFVPYDGQWSSPDMHRNLIRDDLLGEWVETLRSKLGPEGFVLILFDACHSGSGLRGSTGNRTNWSRRSIHDVEHPSGVAPMTVLYSSLPHQPSIEVRVDQNRRCALMTWSFVKALEESAPGATWRSVFERTAANMSKRTRKQIPSWEGETDRLIFGVSQSVPPAYFRIVGQIDSQTVLIDGGGFHGLRMGSVLSFYPADTRELQFSVPLALGNVTEYCGAIESMVRIATPMQEHELSDMWVFPENSEAEVYPVMIHFFETGWELREALVRSTTNIPGLNWVDSQEARLLVNKDHNILRISDRHRGAMMQWSCKKYKDEELIGFLRERILRWQMAQFLISWESNDQAMQVSLLAGKEKEAQQSVTGKSNMVLRKNDDILNLKIRNNGNRPVYYTILDIDPEDLVRVLIPGPGRLAEEYRVLPGEESRTHQVRFDKSGPQVLKLLASTVPVNMDSTIRMRGHAENHQDNSSVSKDMLTRLKELTPSTSGFFHTETLEFIIE